MDKTGGCPPLVVAFTNTSSGASANAMYEWDFGNGNTSVLKNTGASFYTAQQYTVRLTVKDGSQTAVQTKTVTVYKKPVIDFAALPVNGCLPLPVTFTGNVTPGDGTIASYQWDFGDGSTQQTPGNTIVHNYTFEQTATVSLTAINSYGCAGTITKPNIVTVQKALTASFTADRTIACNAPAAIQFTNASTGPGTLTYAWDFGDGNTSTAQNPLHTYTTKGTYTVTLVVNSSEGCSRTFTRNAYINVEDFVADFAVPQPVCDGSLVQLVNTSSPTPGQCTWVIDGATTIVTIGNNPLNYVFNKGLHAVQLTANFGPCQRTITKQVDAKGVPVVNGFLVDITGECGAPVQVNFSDTTTGAVSWQWNFDYWSNNTTVHSTQKSPFHTYNRDDNYRVLLTVKNADGCAASVAKQVGISKPLVGIFRIQTPDRPYVCAPFTTQYEYRTTDPLVSYQWDFGDGTQSTDASPSHTFTKAGSYAVSLKYVTSKGCTGTTYLTQLYVRDKPVADFSSLSGTSICGNSVVNFRSSSTGIVTSEWWYVDDKYVGSSYYNMFDYQFYTEGLHTIRMIAENIGCSDTITKVDYIKVSPPFAKLGPVINTCDGNRDLVTFNDASRLADKWDWDFGDGTTQSYTVQQPSLPHTYSKSGAYKVMLTVTQGACSVRDSVRVHVILKQKPLLTASQGAICDDQGLNYVLSNLETSPNTGVWVSYFFNKWEYGDNSLFLGTNTQDFNFVQPLPYNGTLGRLDRNKDQVRVIVSNSTFGCLDTSNYIPLLFANTKAAFDVTANTCFKDPVIFVDKSQSSPAYPVLSWRWDFGDGQVQTFTQGNTFSHLYRDPGNYYVKLTVTDGSGCSSTTTGQYIQITGPKAAFSPSGTNVQLNTSVNFYNNSNTYNSPNTTWKWDFGNGITSTAFSPSYTYTAPGDYIVTLIALNPQTQCGDTVKQTITVKNFNTGFTTQASFIGNNNLCPPVLARFTNTSVNYTRLVWDFGDGTVLENQYAPSHIYNTAGTYIVTLTVHGYNGLIGIYKDTIAAGQPTISIAANDAEGCIGHSVLLNAPVHAGAVSYTWDFGNGYTVNAADSFATHQFSHPGSYTASLIVKDAKGCASVVSLTDKIIIHPDPEIKIDPVDPVSCKGAPVQLTASGGINYTWSPANGLNDPLNAAPFASPLSTTAYHVNAIDANGCTGSKDITVTVPQPFKLNGVNAFDVCSGSTAQLNVGGAQTYQWIRTTTALNNTGIRNPVASPAQTTIYTVVGYDQYPCYTDTMDIIVNVRPLPSVNAGPDKDVLFGSENTLNITYSPDVIKWNWSPADFLSCTNCSTPVSKTYASTEYVVTVTNNYNCTAKDAVIIKASCGGDNMHIPTAFTPNNDGNNDVFAVMGNGVSIIKSMRIYNRWGELVFEKKNFYPNDRSAAWNGKYKGIEAPTGNYIYYVEMTCSPGNEVFVRKGSVTLIR